ncbi:YjfB family protein [Noviherbaspirillum galbum]|uniref:Putative motility protein n=1 Tax=Noviherbaspirillum galbum TaxID=2709383 RepID=A0A6B3SPZ9_9BURK|nr:YjfB family protein [Noviherbaspirillum galbum]NEX62833.1 putative motility protein [Noviherbaspirillum galbum]
MEINSIASFATPARTPDADDTVGLAVQKKTEEVQAATASALIESLPPATPAASAVKPGDNDKPAYNLPSHLGKNINTTA